MKCGNCPKTDGTVYTSNPPKVRCTVTGNFHFYGDECDCKYITTNHTPDPNIEKVIVKRIPWNEVNLYPPPKIPDPTIINPPEVKTALEIEVEALTKEVHELEVLLRNSLEDLEKRLRRLENDLSDL